MRAVLLFGWVALACAGASGQTKTGAPQGLSAEEIADVVRAHMKVFQGCFVIAEGNPGRLRIVFEVAPNGSVNEVKVGDSTVGNATLEACLARTFEKMKFPAAKKPTRASFPFQFHPKK